jgi:hypothetical protein
MNGDHPIQPFAALVEDLPRLRFANGCGALTPLKRVERAA